MKRKLLIILSLVLAIGLAGCGSGEKDSGTSKKTEKEKPVALKVTEQGYTVFGEDDLYLYYGVKIENSNKSTTADYVTLRITARDENGAVLGTEDQVFSKIYANTTIGFGSQAMSVSKAPSKVDFEIVDQEWLSKEFKYKEMKSDATQLTRDEYGDATVTGEIINENAEDFDSVAVTVLFRDANGNILFGETTYIDSVKGNSKTPFSVDILEGATDTYEVYAMPWI